MKWSLILGISTDNMNHSTNTKKGYTLLFAILLTSIILSVSISILNISQKEVILSSSSRDSQIALYAADSALECAQYFDTIGKFSTSTPTVQSISCNGVAVHNVVYSLSQSGNNRTWTSDTIGPFKIKDTPEDEPCASIQIIKQGITNDPITSIISVRGYNTCDNTNPKRVERALRVSY
jgi:Tfp pilus assembly protein PilX